MIRMMDDAARDALARKRGKGKSRGYKGAKEQSYRQIVNSADPEGVKGFLRSFKPKAKKHG